MERCKYFRTIRFHGNPHTNSCGKNAWCNKNLGCEKCPEYEKADLSKESILTVIGEFSANYKKDGWHVPEDLYEQLAEEIVKFIKQV